jgi:hypothetical protein
MSDNNCTVGLSEGFRLHLVDAIGRAFENLKNYQLFAWCQKVPKKSLETIPLFSCV